MKLESGEGRDVSESYMSCCGETRRYCRARLMCAVPLYGSRLAGSNFYAHRSTRFWVARWAQATIINAASLSSTRGSSGCTRSSYTPPSLCYPPPPPPPPPCHRNVCVRQEEAKAAGAARMEGKKPGAGSDVCGGSKLGMENPREAVSIRGMVGPRHGGLELDETPQLSEVCYLL